MNSCSLRKVHLNKLYFNPLIPKIWLVTFLSGCYTIYCTLVKRIWLYINSASSSWYHCLFSSPFLLDNVLILLGEVNYMLIKLLLGVKGLRCGFNMWDEKSLITVSATSTNLTHAQCEFQPWADYIPGRYNLSVVITQNGQADVKTNTSLQIYYYNCTDLSVTSVVPNEVLLDELPLDATLEGSGFFDWEETLCYFGPQVTTDVIFVDTSRLKCKVGGPAAIGQ